LATDVAPITTLPKVNEVGVRVTAALPLPFTVRLTVVVAVRLPEVPVMVTVDVPVVAAALAVRVKVLVVVVVLGENAAVTPVGKPDAVNLTLPVNPPDGTTVTVLVPLLPCATVSALGDALRLKPGVPPEQPGKTKLPIAVLQLKPPFAFSYSSANQKVQSSVGSMVTEL
jgi:hypothetical protein